MSGWRRLDQPFRYTAARTARSTDVRHDPNRDAGTHREPINQGRRMLLRGAVAASGVLGAAAALPVEVFARQQAAGGTRAAPPNSALRLAQFLNKTRYSELPPKAIEHAKMILASTFASAAPGSLIDSARILRDLAKESAGKPQATIWFDGTRLPGRAAARGHAGLRHAASPGR